VKFFIDNEYKLNSDVIESNKGKYRVSRYSEETNFYNDNLHGGIIENSFINNGETS
jgi:hypothetical protein